MLIAAKTFSKQALQPISFHRGRHLLSRDRKSEARAVAGAIADQDSDACVAASSIIFENLLKIDRSR